MASIADQTVEELGGPGSVLSRQRRDHEELDRLLSRLAEAEGADQDEVLTGSGASSSRMRSPRRPCCGRRCVPPCRTGRR